MSRLSVVGYGELRYGIKTTNTVGVVEASMPLGGMSNGPARYDTVR